MVLVSMIRKGRLATKDTKREKDRKRERRKKESIKAPGQSHGHKQEAGGSTRSMLAQGELKVIRSGWGFRCHVWTAESKGVTVFQNQMQLSQQKSKLNQLLQTRRLDLMWGFTPLQLLS